MNADDGVRSNERKSVSAFRFNLGLDLLVCAKVVEGDVFSYYGYTHEHKQNTNISRPI